MARVAAARRSLRQSSPQGRQPFVRDLYACVAAAAEPHSAAGSATTAAFPTATAALIGPCVVCNSCCRRQAVSECILEPASDSDAIAPAGQRRAV